MENDVEPSTLRNAAFALLVPVLAAVHAHAEAGGTTLTREVPFDVHGGGEGGAAWREMEGVLRTARGADCEVVGLGDEGSFVLRGEAPAAEGAAERILGNSRRLAEPIELEVEIHEVVHGGDGAPGPAEAVLEDGIPRIDMAAHADAPHAVPRLDAPRGGRREAVRATLSRSGETSLRNSMRVSLRNDGRQRYSMEKNDSGNAAAAAHPPPAERGLPPGPGNESSRGA